MISRQQLIVNTDTGTQTVLGSTVMGEIAQMQWIPSTGDTGGDLALYLDTNRADTGEAVLVYNATDTLGTAFVRVPMQGNVWDTGTPVPFVASNERLRAFITPGGAAVVGKLNIWVRSRLT